MFRKFLVSFFLILLFSSLLSCQDSSTTLSVETQPPAINSPTIQPDTPTPLLTPSRTKPPTKTSYPTWTPEPSATLAPTATLQEPLKLAENVLPVAMIDHFMGFWSPDSNKMVGSHSIDPEPPVGAFASAPEFELEFIETQGEPFIASPEFYHWNPNGKNFLAGWIPIELFESSWPESSLPVTVDREGSRIDSVLKEQPSYSWMDFYGWMNPQIIAISEYAGGGHLVFHIIDINKKTLLASVTINGEGHQANQHYIPVDQEGFNGYQAMVVTRYAQPKPVEVAFEMSSNARLFPQQAVQTEANTFFKDWMPVSNQMLVQAAGRTGDLDEPGWSELVLWDVDTDQVRLIVPGGLDGDFSPDGKSLAFVTYGPAVLQENGKLNAAAPLEVDPEQGTTLQWMTFEDRIVRLSMPILLEYDVVIRFSQDSRYLAFLAPGKPQLDETGWPTGVIPGEDETPTLVVLDVIEHRMVYSAPASDSAAFEFSPSATHLVYQDDGEEWVLVNFESGLVTPVTVTGGSRLISPTWSYDGQYFQLVEDLDQGQTNSWVFETLE